MIGFVEQRKILKITNADKIRNMNDDELNKFMNSIGDGDVLCSYMGKEFHNSCANPDIDMCRGCVMKWLKSEVSE